MTAFALVQPVLDEDDANIGFLEGPNNDNPWGPEQGVLHAAYCCSAICVVCYHHGTRFPDDAQLGEYGWAYVPWIVQWAKDHGAWIAADDPDFVDKALPGMAACFAWTRGSAGDHIERTHAVYGDATIDTVGYNTGSPEGCHGPIRRDHLYLMGLVDFFAAGWLVESAPAPPPPDAKPTPTSAPGEDADAMNYVQAVNAIETLFVRHQGKPKNEDVARELDKITEFAAKDDIAGMNHHVLEVGVALAGLG